MLQGSAISNRSYSKSTFSVVDQFWLSSIVVSINDGGLWCNLWADFQIFGGGCVRVLTIGWNWRCVRILGRLGLGDGGDSLNSVKEYFYACIIIPLFWFINVEFRNMWIMCSSGEQLALISAVWWILRY
jgi:hypothetical protein